MAHTYLNAGIKRKQQIHNWFIDIIKERLSFNKKYILSKKLAFENKFNESVAIFDSLLNDILNRNPENIGLVLGYDISGFGYNRVLQDLYNGTVLQKIPKQRKKVMPTQKKVDFEEYIQTPKKVTKRKIVYGFDTKGVKREAILQSIFIEKTKTTTIILRDKKTGRFLKKPKSYKTRKK